MIHVTPEGTTLGWGFNFYPKVDGHNGGFRFKVSSKTVFWMRRRKKLGSWHIQWKTRS